MFPLLIMSFCSCRDSTVTGLFSPNIHPLFSVFSSSSSGTNSLFSFSFCDLLAELQRDVSVFGWRLPAACHRYIWTLQRNVINCSASLGTAINIGGGESCFVLVQQLHRGRKLWLLRPFAFEFHNCLLSFFSIAWKVWNFRLYFEGGADTFLQTIIKKNHPFVCVHSCPTAPAWFCGSPVPYYPCFSCFGLFLTRIPFRLQCLDVYWRYVYISLLLKTGATLMEPVSCHIGPSSTVSFPAALKTNPFLQQWWLIMWITSPPFPVIFPLLTNKLPPPQTSDIRARVPNDHFL